mgnify:CR=1 FL=1
MNAKRVTLTTREKIKNLFDKRIILIRENKKEQAESRLYADLVEKKFSEYTIPNEFIQLHTEDLKNLQNKIEEEKDKIEFCGLLTDLFHNRIDYIVGDFDAEMDSSIKSTMEKEITQELCEIFNSDGIYNSNGCFLSSFRTNSESSSLKDL